MSKKSNSNPETSDFFIGIAFIAIAIVISYSLGVVFGELHDDSYHPNTFLSIVGCGFGHPLLIFMALVTIWLFFYVAYKFIKMLGGSLGKRLINDYEIIR